LLDKRDYDGAVAAYQAVLSSALAGADADVKGRALEGSGFAKEGKGDLDGALSTFRQLEGLDGKGYKELGEYHEARLLLGKGETDKAKELLKAAHEKLSTPSTEGSNQFPFLLALVDETLRKLDPSAVPPRADLSTGAKGSMSPEELQKRLRKAMEAAGQKGP